VVRENFCKSEAILSHSPQGRFFRLARRRSPKPRGFGAGEVKRKCGSPQKSAGSAPAAGWQRKFGPPRHQPHLSGKALAAGSFFVSRFFAPAPGWQRKFGPPRHRPHLSGKALAAGSSRQPPVRQRGKTLRLARTLKK
jgi:hypothetical protein